MSDAVPFPPFPPFPPLPPSCDFRHSVRRSTLRSPRRHPDIPTAPRAPWAHSGHHVPGTTRRGARRRARQVARGWQARASPRAARQFRRGSRRGHPRDPGRAGTHGLDPMRLTTRTVRPKPWLWRAARRPYAASRAGAVRAAFAARPRPSKRPSHRFPRSYADRTQPDRTGVAPGCDRIWRKPRTPTGARAKGAQVHSHRRPLWRSIPRSPLKHKFEQKISETEIYETDDFC